MKAIDAIRTTLKFSDMGIKYLADMREAILRIQSYTAAITYDHFSPMPRRKMP